jgi:squalene-hopene/tetraprenyl-beta-curcumene cyclase
MFTRRDWMKLAAVSPTLSVFPIRVWAAPSADDIKPIVEKALGFLKGAQKDGGEFFPKAGEPGLTALIVASLLRNGVPADNPVIIKSVGYLEKNVQKDGGVYQRGQANYMTCLALVTFKELNTGGKYDKVIDSATRFVKGLQNDSDPKSLEHGGVGYDGKSRPDLSNTHFMVEALLAAGVSKDDPAIKKALVFVSRSQNLKSEFNEQPYAAKATEDDAGGFVYNPADQDNAKSPKRTAEGGLRSEGAMTYAGLKSFLYAGVGKDDPRVKAAVAWVRKHYSVTENPGQKDSGLFYYYHTFAKAMDVLGEEPFIDAKGVKHDWRQELFDELKKRQKPDGSWANSNTAFLEGVPELATAFALLSLSYCKKK